MSASRKRPAGEQGACGYCGGALSPRHRRYCSKLCLLRGNNRARQTWTDAALCASLVRYVAEFGPLPGSGRYQRTVAQRPDYPRRGTLESRFGSLRAAGEAAGVAMDLLKRDWTAEERSQLAELVGTLSYAQIARRLGRRYHAVQHQTQVAGLVAATNQGCLTAREVAGLLAWNETTIKVALRAGLFPGARKVGHLWQIPPGSLLAAEGLLYARLADLPADWGSLIREDLRALSGAHRARVMAWQAYRQEGLWYEWRHGEIAAWWAARERTERAG